MSGRTEARMGCAGGEGSVSGTSGANAAQDMSYETGGNVTPDMSGATGANAAHGMGCASGANAMQDMSGETGMNATPDMSGATGANTARATGGATCANAARATDGATCANAARDTGGATCANAARATGGATGANAARVKSGATGANTARATGGATGANAAHCISSARAVSGSPGAFCPTAPPALSNRQKGAHGERLAEEYLSRLGMTSVARNYRTRQGEIDLIMMDGNVMVFIEVKLRSGPRYGAPAEAVNALKRTRITQVAAQYMADHGGVERAARFDVVEVDGGALRHITGAFDAQGW